MSIRFVAMMTLMFVVASRHSPELGFSMFFLFLIEILITVWF